MPISIDAGPAAWAFGACAVAMLLIVCVTVVILAGKPNSVALVQAFAEVIRAFRKPSRVARTAPPVEAATDVGQIGRVA